MKQLYLIGLLLISPFAQSQLLSETENLASNILSTLETTTAIKTMVSNKKTVEGQLKDIKTWTLNAQLDQNSYSKLHTAYTSYSNIMNGIIDKLQADLMSVESTRQLKQVKMNRLLTKFNNRYAADLHSAYQIYTNDFHPALQGAQAKVSSKSGIIPTILLVVKFGETLFYEIKSLFSKDDLGRQARADIIQSAMGLTLNELTKSLRYPDWDEFIPPLNQQLQTTLSGKMNTTSGNRTTQYPQAAAVSSVNASATIGLSFYGSDLPIEIHSENKSIVVGGQLNEAPSLYMVDKPLKNGDRFWVKMQGFAYANFFYYDELSQSWQDPYGKSILVGGELGNSKQVVKYLPGSRAYFEIGGSAAMEQFLILASASPIEQNMRSFLIGRTETGTQLLSVLTANFPQISNQTKGNTVTTGQVIEFEQQRTSLSIVPLYIVIPKQNINSMRP